MDKEKLKEISQYLEQVFDFSEFIKESSKYPSIETLQMKEQDSIEMQGEETPRTSFHKTSMSDYQVCVS